MAIKILIAGDFVPQLRLKEAFLSGKAKEVWGDIPSVVADSDYSVLNLECPVFNGTAQPIKKTGPNLSCGSYTVDSIKYAGFDGVTLANNHFRDYGDDEIRSTLDLLDSNNIDHLGGGLNPQEAAKVLYKQIEDKKIAFVNMCENEWSIVTDNHAGSNPLDEISLYYTITEAKKNSDYLIAIIHGGKELYQLPTPRMKRLYRYIIDLGADSVINHHQHCFSGYEVYHEKPIFYGLGNFLFDKGGLYLDGWHDGYMVQLELDDTVHFHMLPYRQCDENVGISLLTDKTTFFKKIDELNEIIANDFLLESHYSEIVFKNVDIVKGLLEPYLCRYYRGFVNKFKWPFLQTTDGYKLLMANLQCETHFDVFLAALKTIVNKK